VDVLEMDAASRTGVDDIREIIESVRYAPSSARYKVYIIDEVHMLTKNAFNALLKTLEEPPPHVKFIFATTEIRKLPVTVLSRCQRFDLRRVAADVLIAHLKKIVASEGVTVEDKALVLIVRAAEGSVRDALSLLDQAIAHGGGTATETQTRAMLGLADRARILDLFEVLMAGKTAEALDGLREQYDLGADPLVILADLMEVAHWLTRLKIVPDAGSDALVAESERRQGGEMAAKLGMAPLTRAWQMLLKGINEVQRAPIAIDAAEMVLIRLAYAAELPAPAELVKSLQEGKTQTQTQPPPPAPTSTIVPPAGADARAQPAAEAAAETAPGSNGETQPTASAGSATVLALKTDETTAGSVEDPMPVTYAALIQLFEKHREGVIGKVLHDDVRLVSFRPGAVAINPSGSVPVDLASRMRSCLKTWTGNDWVVSISSETGEESLRQQEASREQARMAEVLEDPLVKRVLEIFPGARVANITDHGDEQAAPAPDELGPDEPNDEQP
jgi:DNA polymerase-3 subunit gamma/tau